MKRNTLRRNHIKYEFRLIDYPIFFWALAYIWLEFSNPVLASQLQVLPKIPNGAFAVILCWMFFPNPLKVIQIPIKPVKWAIPFLLIATINLPFVAFEQRRSIVELVSTWFWVLLLIPIIVRVLSTPSGRLHFAAFTAIGVSLLGLLYLSRLAEGNLVFGRVLLSHNLVAPGIILILPVIVGYIFCLSGLPRFLFLIALGILLIVLFPLGSRAGWLIVCLELLLLIFILPKSKTLLTGISSTCFFLILLSFWNPLQLYPARVLDHLHIRWRKTIEWERDQTVWKRGGVIEKTKMMLNERPWLGVGYSNRSFAAFDAGEVDFLGHLTTVKRIDAHNTYLNVLGGTGVLGFLAFLFYLSKVFTTTRHIPTKIWRRLDSGPFIISVIGLLLWDMSSTSNFATIAINTSILFALFIFHYNTDIAPNNYHG